jgi:hypothetical protein|tara:strand:+ start:64 stop:1344 length:1281 start_codon:yes stop_codon:yes gene_type:complete
MDRISSKEVLSMMDAVAQVYSEQATPDYASMSDEEFAALVKKSGNPEGLIAKRMQQREVASRENSRSNYTAADAKRDQEAAKIKAENERRASRGEDPLPTSQPAQVSQPTAKPPTDQQKVRAEYDRLRYSKDPKERAQAAGYGKAMASAGAAKKDFSGYKSAADLAKSNSNNSRTISGVMSNKSASGSGPGGYQTPVSARPKTTAGAAARVGATPVTAPATPAAKPKLSIADRLQQIRDMRARSQARITAQGGTPATPTVKASAPSTTGATTTPTVKPAAKVEKKQPLKNGDPMERMTGKGAASLLETYSKVYEEREPQAIDEGIMGALAKVGEVVAEEKTAADPGMKARMGKEAPKKGGYQLPKRTPENAKNVEYYKDDADLFDIIKGHFIEEGLTEEEALVKMFELTEDEKIEILNKTTTEENS